MRFQYQRSMSGGKEIALNLPTASLLQLYNTYSANRTSDRICCSMLHNKRQTPLPIRTSDLIRKTITEHLLAPCIEKRISAEGLTMEQKNVALATKHKLCSRQ